MKTELTQLPAGYQPPAGKHTVVRLDSGVLIIVGTLSRFQLQAIEVSSRRVHPEPDAEAYRIEIAPEVSGRDTPMYEPGTNNPEYVQALAEARNEQAIYIMRMYRDMCVHFPELGNRDAVIEHFAPYIAEQRALFGDAMSGADEFDITWRYAILRSLNDEELVNLLVRKQQDLPLEEVELALGLQMFRLKVPGETATRLAQKRANASGVQRVPPQGPNR